MKRLVKCLNPRCGKQFWVESDKNGNTDRAFCQECRNYLRQRKMRIDNYKRDYGVPVQRERSKE